MNDLNIDITNDLRGFRPGEIVGGNINWSVSQAVTHAELALFWYTRGKGTQDVEIVDTLKIVHAGQSHRQEFKFVLPDAPYSFSGKLVSVIWALELVLTPGDLSTRFEFVVGPDSKEVVLHQNGF